MVSVSALVESAEPDLLWCAGRSGGERVLDVPSGALPLMGVYNPERAQSVLVLGAQEVQRIGPGNADGLSVFDFFHDDVRIVVVAGGCRAPDDLEEQADERGVALLRSELDEAPLLALLYRRMARMCAPSCRVHGVLVSVAGVGTLILGAQGVGKSSLALELLGRGHQLIVDDDVSIYRDGDGRLCGENQGPDGLQGFLFVRGLGMIDVIAEFGPFALRSRVEVGQVVRLDQGPIMKQPQNGSKADGLEGDLSREVVLGVDLPCLWVRSRYTAADRLESYTRRRLLAARGYDVPAVFRARHAAMLQRKR